MPGPSPLEPKRIGVTAPDRIRMILRRLSYLLASALLILLVGLSGACSPQEAGDDAGTSDAAVEYPTVTIATFNVRRLFDTECDSSRCGSDSFEKVPSVDEYEARIAEVAAAVDALGADIVLLQEIEKEAVLTSVQQALGGAYPVAVFGEVGYSASLDVAVLARGELRGTQGYRDQDLIRPGGGTTEFAREFLRADLEIDGEEVIVFTAHFKSKRNDDPERRLAEARGARDIIEQAAADNPEALVVLGGDLNDTPGSEPLEALTGDGGLVRAGASKSLDELYTYLYNWEKTAIDHLLMARTPGGSYVSGSAKAHHDRNPAGYGGSDHGALSGQFQLR